MMDDEPLRTVFVSGLPDDASEREIYLLCRTCPGYEYCTLTTQKGALIAFCTFLTNEEAMQAMDSLAGQQFDPNSTTAIRTELAKKNSKRPRTDGANGSASHRSRPSGQGAQPQFPYGATAMPPYAPTMDYGMQGAAYGAYPPYAGHSPAMGGFPPSAGGHTGGSRGGPAPGPGGCTLFVAGLGMATENTIRALFGQTPGLKNIKLKGGDGVKSAVAWIQYDTPQASMEAQRAYHGAIAGFGEGGIRVEFAKSEMSVN